MQACGGEAHRAASHHPPHVTTSQKAGAANTAPTRPQLLITAPPPAHTQASYVPLRLSQRMYIIPEWDAPPLDQEPGAINIILQPGVAFGTGGQLTT